jgi:hypothetical protein
MRYGWVRLMGEAWCRSLDVDVDMVVDLIVI